jgi:hypothetical protein
VPDLALDHLLHETITAAAPGADLAVAVTGRGALDSVFPVTDLATASVAAAGVAAARWTDPDAPPAVTVDRALASHWFAFSIRPVDFELPPVWDAVAGDYRARDRWIRLHTNAPHHRAAALAVLDAPEDRDAVTRAVAQWDADALETAVVAAGGCAAAMRDRDAWAARPQGAAVAAEPLVAWSDPADGAVDRLVVVDPARPLTGIRVLDLTRVLAGPVATRFLAGLGAEVLRIDPPDWDEDAVVPEVTVGKRCAGLDLRTEEDRERLRDLLRAADVLVHGYRPGALDGLGLDAATRRDLAPHLVDVSLDAYGWSGPWAGRRGFDSLVQMSTGIAHAGMTAAGADRPVPLPVQALDHATGYLVAAAALTGLASRRTGRGPTTARLSLARTAKLLVDARGTPLAGPLPADPPVSDTIETTTWGAARRLVPPLTIAGVDYRWDRPARALRSDPPTW